MFKKISSFLAKLADNTICFDIAQNREKALSEFRSLIKEPENFKHRLQEFQAESSVMDRFATEKNNRLLLFLTIIITMMTIVLLFK